MAARVRRQRFAMSTAYLQSVRLLTSCQSSSLRGSNVTHLQMYVASVRPVECCYQLEMEVRGVHAVWRLRNPLELPSACAQYARMVRSCRGLTDYRMVTWGLFESLAESARVYGVQPVAQACLQETTHRAVHSILQSGCRREKRACIRGTDCLAFRLSGDDRGRGHSNSTVPTWKQSCESAR